MGLRLPFRELAPEAVRDLRTVNQTLKERSDPRLLELVRLRASQVNGCSFCIDMHTRDALAAGETEHRLAALAEWRTSTLFSEREKVLLAWTESLTHVAETHAPDADFAALRPHFTETEIAHYTFAIAVINAWNRIAIGFRL